MSFVSCVSPTTTCPKFVLASSQSSARPQSKLVRFGLQVWSAFGRSFAKFGSKSGSAFRVLLAHFGRKSCSFSGRFCLEIGRERRAKPERNHREHEAKAQGLRGRRPEDPLAPGAGRYISAGPIYIGNSPTRRTCVNFKNSKINLISKKS